MSGLKVRVRMFKPYNLLTFKFHRLLTCCKPSKPMKTDDPPGFFIGSGSRDWVLALAAAPNPTRAGADVGDIANGYL